MSNKIEKGKKSITVEKWAGENLIHKQKEIQMSLSHMKKKFNFTQRKRNLCRTTLRYGFIQLRLTKIPKSVDILLVRLRKQSLP